MGTVYAGLDVGSSTCHVVAIDPDGNEVVNKKIDTGEKNLIEVFQSIRGEVHVHLEASEMSGWARQVVARCVRRVVVGDAKTNAWIAKDPHKKDSVDAAKLAMLLRMGQVREVYYDSREDRTVFKQVVRHYDDLNHQQVNLKLKIKSRYRIQGVVPRGTSVYGVKGRERWLAQIPSSETRESIEQLYAVLDSTLDALKNGYAHMVRLAKPYPEIERFDKVPGVGKIGACRFSAYLQTPHRFSSKRKLWRYCGLAVTDRSSDGKPIGRQALDWSGNRHLKDMSYKAFLGALLTKRDNLLKRTFQGVLRSTKDRTHARLTTQRKILAILWAMWRDGTEYQDEMGKVR